MGDRHSIGHMLSLRADMRPVGHKKESGGSMLSDDVPQNPCPSKSDQPTVPHFSRVPRTREESSGQLKGKLEVKSLIPKHIDYEKK